MLENKFVVTAWLVIGLLTSALAISMAGIIGLI
jgi:hypothetical protein